MSQADPLPGLAVPARPRGTLGVLTRAHIEALADDLDSSGQVLAAVMVRLADGADTAPAYALAGIAAQLVDAWEKLRELIPKDDAWTELERELSGAVNDGMDQ